MVITLQHYLIVAALLFCMGLVCVVARRNVVGILIGIELMLNAANLNFVAFARYGGGRVDGQIFALFVILLAACQAAVGLAILISLFRAVGSVDPVDRRNPPNRRPPIAP